jgi:large subunit ribosomal protein L30
MATPKPRRIAVTLSRSPIGHPGKIRAVLVSLGLKRIRQTVTHQDSPQIRGMIAKVVHLVNIDAAG